MTSIRILATTVVAALIAAAVMAGGASGGISSVEIRKQSTAKNSNPIKEVDVDCSTDFVLVGGGAELRGEGTNVALQDSAPEPQGEATWSARAAEINPTSASWKLTARVVCIDF
jgi:hypothetical protein